jgi:phosphoribosylaminoimidazolecarboxamide formyltransferase/IMP cyclohydrolase
MQRRALISVSDKRGVVELATALSALGYEIVSTGGTAKALAKAGVPVTPIEVITGFPEMMDGRVKTLHPNVHGGILARRDIPDHVNSMEEYGIGPIDIVAVNLYPFRETVAKPGVTWDEAVENIDIGGPSMVRSAAKNHEFVTVVVDPEDYQGLIGALKNNALDQTARRQLAQKAFAHTAAYDSAIANWLGGQLQITDGDLLLPLTMPDKLRYGENPHQQAWRYNDEAKVLVDAAPFKIHQGKELSYNNLVDADAAWALLCDLPVDLPGCVIIKHTNPCGVGVVPTSVGGAILRALEADPVSAFGGVLAVNREFDVTAARAVGDRFLEVILAPSFDEDALQILSVKTNLRVVTMGAPRTDNVKRVVKSTVFGVLVQTPDNDGLSVRNAQVVTKKTPTEAQWAALDIAWRVCKHVKSNAIVTADEQGTVGVGAGQMSRVDSAIIATGKVRKHLKAIAAGSDAFFPFPDGLEQLAKAGIQAVAQPGGSKKDQEVIDAADKAGIAMVMTGFRHFRH